VPLLYSTALFAGAFLLFLVQPMVGRILLPKLGGTPAVWNACLVFFQTVLLAGYGYSHLAVKFGPRRYAIAHVIVLLLPLSVLPIAISDDAFRTAAATERPAMLTLELLAVAVGLPTFVLSTTGPLLQRWFVDTGHHSAKDPYFLYAAGNLGSLLGLLAYPAVVEPFMPLQSQCVLWTWGYAAYAALVVSCGLALWRASPYLAVHKKIEPTVGAATTLTSVRRLRWLFLAFVPSSLLLGVTNYISLDIAPIPLFWIIPLAIYLLSFILTFAQRPLIPHRVIGRMFPIFMLMLTLVLLTGATALRGLSVAPLLGLHLLLFFLAAMAGHGELAKDRPSTSHLTEFYVWVSLGGVLGGMFNALIAPLIFQHLGLIEYPLALILSCFLFRRESKTARRIIARDFLEPGILGLMTIGLILLAAALEPHVANMRERLEESDQWQFLAEFLNLSTGPLRAGLTFGIPCVLLYTLVERPVRFGIGVAALLLAGAFRADFHWPHIERNFFGVTKVDVVTSSEGERFRALFHGNTIHGQQSLDRLDHEGRHEPLTYYHRTGPIGVLCKAWFKDRPRAQQVACIGLGIGSLAYYARPGDHWTFYEIDPAVKRLAENPRYFSFLNECRAGLPEVILGDARLKLLDAPDRAYDLIILDAFNSDSIPMHLLTCEAFRLYERKLQSRGVIAMHLSNRYLNLWPIVARLGDDSRMIARGYDDRFTHPEMHPGKTDSEWLILAREEADFGVAVWPHGVGQFEDPRWKKVLPRPSTPLWTDDFSNLLSAFGRHDQ
jgi:hypothetical protein